MEEERPTAFKKFITGETSEIEDNFETDVTGTMVLEDLDTIEGRGVLFNQLYEIPGTELELNFKNIITNPPALKKIFARFDLISD
jgi:hypothetical protein